MYIPMCVCCLVVRALLALSSCVSSLTFLKQLQSQHRSCFFSAVSSLSLACSFLTNGGSTQKKLKNAHAGKKSKARAETGADFGGGEDR